MPTGQGPAEEARGARLAEFIVTHAAEILGDWKASVRRLPSGRDLPEPILLDSVPQLLAEIAQAIADSSGSEPRPPRRLVEEHALHRLESGFDLAQVVSEYSLLRDAIVRRWEADPTRLAERGAERALNRAIDESISMSIERFTQAQARAVRAMDQIATASLESHDLEDLLRRLLLVLIGTIPAIDTGAILLRQGDSLRVRAAVGLEREVDFDVALKIGQGFAGTIAAQRRPISVRSAANDPLVESPVIRERGVRALHGVPLIDAGEVVGVAYIGSLTAYEFAEEDRRILDGLAARAAAAISQQMLRRDAERRAAELTAVIESIPDAVFIADDKRITTTNPRGLELLGVGSVEELRGGHADVLALLSARDASTGEAVGESALVRALKGETIIDELAIVRPDGEVRIIRSAIAPIAIGGKIELAVSVATDVTEARRYERERAELLDREREARGRAERAEAGQRFLSEATAILSSSLEYERTLELVTTLAVPRLADSCAVDLQDEEGRVRTVSVAHEDPAKLQTAKLLAEKYPIGSTSPFGAPEAIQTGRPQMETDVDDERLLAIAQNEEHLGILRALGLTSYIVVPISSRGTVLGALTLATVRESGRRYGPSELEIAEHLGRRAGLAIENARLYRGSQEAIRLREQVLAIVSHDLRNPLSVVTMAATAIVRRARELGEARLMRRAESVERSASRMERLIADLLDMASIEAGRLKVELSPQLVEGLVREAIEFQLPIASEHGIELAAEMDVGGAQVDGDRERILEVFSNLLGNALKFGRRGDRITVRARRVGGEVRVSVADNGPGIPAAEQPHIFEAYWSAERNGQKGTGLGLFITKGIIEAHHGRLWVESEPGRGSEFVFTLPITRR